jgi:nucleoside-diphosphate-sugar epimerase
VKTLVNCAMPAYDRWPEEFPALGASVLAVAAEVGADLVTLSNVYGYGRVAGPLREDHALVPHTVKGRVRAGMWDLVRRSGVRATEVRASDFLGRGAVAYFNIFVLPGLLKGEACAFPGDLDATHSWTFTQDAAATLVAAAGSEASWGRVWHVPSSVASIRELAVLTAEQAGVARPALRRMPLAELQALAAAVPVMREVEEMTYLFEGPCVLDSRETERLLGVQASPLEVAVADNLRPAGMP